MQRQVRRTAHAIHSPLAPVTLGLLALGTSLDVLAGGSRGALTSFAFWSIAAGVALGGWCVAGAVLDRLLFAEIGETARATLDGFATTMVVGLYALATLLRMSTPVHAAPAPAVALEVAGAALLVVKAWIGRELAAWHR
jgi:uncharacterized membrane protein